jgi:hypothetical protein
MSIVALIILIIGLWQFYEKNPLYSMIAIIISIVLYLFREEIYTKLFRR